MQTVSRSDPRRAIVRLAVAAAVVGFAIPLLPLYGFGGRPAFVFSLFPLRGLIECFLGRWNSAIVVTLGIVFLRRDHLVFAGGVFGAVALGLALTIAAQIVGTAPHFGRWQTVVFFALEIAQTILLVLAAARAIDASRAESDRSLEVADQGRVKG